MPEPPQTHPARERKLKPVVHDGVAHASMLGSGENYFGAFAVHLQATNWEIGMLAALPPFLGSIFQFTGVRAMERRPRQRRALMVRGAIVQALFLLPIACLSFAVPAVGAAAPLILIALVTGYWAASSFVAPIWSGVVGDMVPPEERGRFFGARNVRVGWATMITLIGAGLVLEVGTRWSMTAAAYLCIFLFAALCRLASSWWLSRYDDPPYEVRPEHYFSFAEFLRRSPSSNFAKFVFFQASMNFAVWIVAPYFAVYMLRDLQFSYMEFMIVTVTGAVSQFLPMHYWGRLTDTFGNKKVLTVCGYGIVVAPLLWLFSANFYYLIFAQAAAGFAWSGYLLSTSNFMFDAVTPPKRARCAAYQSFTNAIMVFAGSMTGAVFALPYFAEPILAALPARFTGGSVIPAIILISAVLRLVLLIIWEPRFREVRTDVEPVRHYELIFRVSHMRPAQGMNVGVLYGAEESAQDASSVSDSAKKL